MWKRLQNLSNWKLFTDTLGAARIRENEEMGVMLFKVGMNKISENILFITTKTHLLELNKIIVTS